MTERLTPEQAMARAVALAALGPEYGPNPRVGAVLTTREGDVLGEGFHRGAGTPHAEVAAIEAAQGAGHSLEGAVAYVTLEPCNHTGRTGPCADALTNVGVSAVRYAVEDPNPVATGGGETLRGRGIDARYAADAAAAALNRRWLYSMRHRRPYVIAKWAQTLDGYTAAPDGTSFWITGDQARDHAHRMRAGADAMLVGTGTILADDPLLTARPGGELAAHQPLRAVMGLRPTPGARVWGDGHAVRLATREPSEALAALWSREVRTVIVEGGAAVVSAFMGAGLVDEVHAYIAPALLGGGTRAVSGLGIATMADALRGSDATVESLGQDVFVSALLGKD